MFKIISHISLSILLLISSTGFTIDRHLCDLKLIDTAVFSKAKSCCDLRGTLDQAESHRSCSIEIEQEADCSNETVQKKAVDYYILSSAGIDFHNYPVPVEFLLSHVNDYSEGSAASKFLHIPEECHSPPTVLQKLSLIQTYLL